MEALSVFVLLWLLSAVPAVVRAENAYFGLGRELVLDPRVDVDITNIAWKLDKNLVADWAEGESVTYFGPFRDRTNLDPKTGVLKLSRATAEDQGVFTVEINNRVLALSYSAKMIEAAPAPEVGIGPLSCDAHSASCTATCDVKGGEPTEPSEPIKYSWKMDHGDWVDGPKQRDIIKAEVKHIKEFFCRMQNPIDHKDSEAKVNPLYEEPPPPTPKWITAVVVIVVFIIFAAVGGGVLWIWKRQWITNLLSRRQAAPAKDPTSTDPNAPDPPNTAVLLDRTGDAQGNGSEAL